MLKKPTLPFLETMATQACNLSCSGCTNYSDLPHKNYVAWQVAKQWIEPWLERIHIDDFGIIGGEPLLNPEITDWLHGCRELMPTSQLRLTTNGLLIKSVTDLLQIFDTIGNIVFKITVHVNSLQLEEIIKEILAARPWQSVTEHNINRWRLDNGVRLQINRPQKFVMTYQGSYKNMMPHRSDPKKAFDLCIQKTCPLLWNKKIYKCSTAGLLQDVLNRVNPVTKSHWTEFIDQGMSVDSDIKVINQFIDNFGKPNSICAQCPDDKSCLIDHLENVNIKKTRFLSHKS